MSTRAWRRVRADVLERDGYQCQLGYPGCLGEASEVDHIISIAATGTARRDALDADWCAAVCSACHRRKTAQEAKAGRNRRRCPPYRHPADWPVGG